MRCFRAIGPNDGFTKRDPKRAVGDWQKRAQKIILAAVANQKFLLGFAVFLKIISARNRRVMTRALRCQQSCMINNLLNANNFLSNLALRIGPLSRDFSNMLGSTAGYGQKQSQNTGKTHK